MGMDETQLDSYLRSLSESESLYITNSQRSHDYTMPSTIELDGRQVFVFDKVGELSLDTIKITKHDRFAPVPLHVHTWVEINYIYSGSCTQIIDRETVVLTEGQLILIDTGVPHAILPTGENDIVINILLSKEMLSTAFLSRLSNKGIVADFLINAISEGRNHNHYIIFHSQDNKKIPRLMRDMLCEYFDQTAYFNEIIESYMVIIFTELLRVFRYDAHQPHAQAANETSLIQILQYIENHYQTCTLSSAAAHFNYSTSYFSTFIKKHTGKTFNELVRMQKLTYASLLIAQTAEPIYEIASKVGYDNLTFFYKKFKQAYGVSPHEYRLRSSPYYPG